MSESMQRARAALISKHGSGYGRIRFNWLCQAHNVTQDEDCPLAMQADVENETAPRMRRFFA